MDLVRGNTALQLAHVLASDSPLDRQHLATYRLQVELLNDQICKASVHILAEGIALQPALSTNQRQAWGGSWIGCDLGPFQPAT